MWHCPALKLFVKGFPMRLLPVLLVLVSCNDTDPLKDTGEPDTAIGVDDTQEAMATDADQDGFSTETDCDDEDAAINPGAVESCDGIDNDCDGLVDDADDPVSGRATWYQDLDGDGYGNQGVAQDTCDAPIGFVADSTDCDDMSALFHPGADESDCTDERDFNCDGSVGYADTDGDGFAACEDCDDTVASTNRLAFEICDGADNDCDGSIDEDAINPSTLYIDGDGDGYGSDTSTGLGCPGSSGYAGVGGDCDDNDSAVYPGATDTWYDGIDSDCDSGDDFDADGDGFSSDAYGGTDCDDTDAAINPNAAEVNGDGVDQDCNGSDGGTITAFDCTGTVSGYYCQPCVDVGNDGSTCQSSQSVSSGVCGSCYLNASLHSPNYSSSYNRSCN